MKFKLSCSKENEERLRHALESAGFQIAEDGDFMVSENNSPKDYLMGRQDESYEVIPIIEIYYIEAFGKEVIAHTKKNQYILSDKLYQLEEQLSQQGFLRVNKSQLINIKQIMEINPWFGQKYNIIMKNKASINVNRIYYKHFRDYFGI